MEFVDCAAAENFCVSHADKLGPPESQRVKAGDACSALLAGIRIVEAVIVEKIVCGKLAPSPVLASIRPEPCRRAPICGYAEVENWSAPIFGDGMYCKRARAGADHALWGIIAFGKTHVALVGIPPCSKALPRKLCNPSFCVSRLAR